ncbi:AmpG family muropeptide MFS transporter [Maribellus sediminis]|uniref:AmpG family muropeptide MFS transporter n=1 Tax=Maribellus sediminis TaxID=2696285 RepID=UPI001430A81D|nr:AmpG family muropeptide MFS transporter [Maribellus sediminis]
MSTKSKQRSPWFWVPSLYFAQGIPYVIVMTLSVIMYKRLGISNTDIALYTSWLYLPWVIKPLWSPIVDILKTKRFWIIIMQLVIGVGLAGVAFTIPVDRFFQITLAFFWLIAFSSATHDIAADGYYMLELSSGDQAFFVGIRSTFYRFAMLTGQGLLVILAGSIETFTGLQPLEVNVSAQQGSAKEIAFNPEDFQITKEQGETRFVAPEELSVSIAKVKAATADSIVQLVNRWNIDHSFYTAEETLAKTERVSAWKKHVSMPMENLLKRVFNRQTPQLGAEVGNIAIIPIQLANVPEADETLVLNFGFDKGDKSIKLTREYRFEFSPKNWDKPAFAVVQLDSKLNKPTQASFIGRSGIITFAWSMVFVVIAGLFALFFLYHRFILPRPESDVANKEQGSGVLKEFLQTFASFFQKKQIGVAILFMLLYRLAESQLVKLASPFLLDAREIGGLGLTTGDLGLVYGTAGMIALTVGGILGGVVASRNGLKYWIWWMAVAINLPNLSYLFLSLFTPESLWYVAAAVVVEQFGYGFGFTAYMLYMIYISQGKYKTAHYALTTGFMALGMMIPGMVSGWLQEIIGYQNFFIWVMICTIPIFLVIPFLKIDPEFGIRKKEE